MSDAVPRISYIGIYPPTIARNAVALKGLRMAGVPVEVYVAEGGGWRKYLRLIRLLFAHRKTTDVWLVGYLSGVVMPFVWAFGGKPIVYNATNSLYEAVVLDRARIAPHSIRARAIWLLDWLAFACSDLILVESEAQKAFLQACFRIPEEKCAVVFTGADDAVFFREDHIKTQAPFRVGFRGGFLPATGISCIIDAAELLQQEPIEFYLYGRGLLLSEIKERIAAKKLQRVHLDERFLDTATLRTVLSSCDVLLGQFSSHPRLERTIQNKTFEALALGMPYITLSTKSNRELLEHGVSAYLIDQPDASILADAIKKLQADASFRRKIEEGAAELYKKRASPFAIGARYKSCIESWLRTQNASR